MSLFVHSVHHSNVEFWNKECNFFFWSSFTKNSRPQALQVKSIFIYADAQIRKMNPNLETNPVSTTSDDWKSLLKCLGSRNTHAAKQCDCHVTHLLISDWSRPLQDWSRPVWPVTVIMSNDFPEIRFGDLINSLTTTRRAGLFGGNMSLLSSVAHLALAHSKYSPLWEFMTTMP